MAGGAFDGKVVVITGGASGLGAALARELAAAGAVVVAADIAADGARAVAAEIAAKGGRAHGAEVDVTDEKSVEALLDGAVRDHGRLDYVFNNAGIGLLGEMRDLSLEQWRRVIDVNLWGVVYGTHFAYRHMLRQGHGHIVNTASGFGLSPGPMFGPYVATKWAVVGLSESLRAEAADLGVRVSVVCPGLVRTAIIDRSPAVGCSMQDYLPLFPFKLIEPDAAARKIVAGVRRNKAVIAFPTYVRFLVWLYRAWPGVSHRMARRSVRDFRAIRREPSPAP